jgi:hypothetical protein
MFTLLLLLHIGVIISISYAETYCRPQISESAYVTSLDGTDENILQVKVLLKSLRSTQTKADIVVLVPDRILNKKIELFLKEEKIKTHIVSDKVIAKVSDDKLLDALPLWSFDLSYNRVIYLDPYSLIERNLDILFSCSGYCGSTFSPHGPIVIEPSKDTFSYLLKQLKFGNPDILIELHYFFNLPTCPPYLPDMNIVLQDEKYVINQQVSSTTSYCNDFKLSPLSSCHTLPLHYGVPASNFTPYSYSKDLICVNCEFYDPKLIVYSRSEPPWEAALLTDKAILWRWYDMRSGIPMTSPEKTDAICALLFPFAILIISLLAFRANRQQLLAPISPAPPDFHNTNDNVLPDIALASPSKYTSGSGSFAMRRSVSTSVISNSTVLNHNANVDSSIDKIMQDSTSDHEELQIKTDYYDKERIHLERKGLSSRNSSIMSLAKGLLILIIVTLWYHIAQLTGRAMVSFLWLPTTSFSVAFSWTLLSLFTGLIGIDHLKYYCQSKGKCHIILIEISLFIIMTVISQYLDIFTTKYILPACITIMNIIFSIRLIRRKIGIEQIKAYYVTMEDINLLLYASMIFSVLCYITYLFNIPEALRLGLLRLFTMLFSTIIVFIYNMIIFEYKVYETILYTYHTIYNSMLQYHQQYLSNIHVSNTHNNSKLSKIISTIKEKKFIVCILLFIAVISILVISVIVNLTFGSWNENIPATSPYFCLKQNHHFINPSNGGFSNVCGASEAFSLQDTGVYVETFGETYKCIEIWYDNNLESESHLSQSNVRYLTRKRETAKTCSIEQSGILFIVNNHHDGNKEGFCLYSSREGEFVSSLPEPQRSCGKTEKWHVVTTHHWTYIWSILSSTISPFFRYDYVRDFPQMAIVILLLMLFLRKQVCTLIAIAVSLY